MTGVGGAVPATVTVSGQANPWLAGAADGSTDGADSAPAQSPVLVPVQAGDGLTFAVTGQAGFMDGAATGPEGVPSSNSFYYSNRSPVNGIWGLQNTPANALIGVFLSDAAPIPGNEGEALNFSTDDSKDYDARVPYIGQPFFIGDGLRLDGVTRQIFYVPDGATRLFLGTMDGSGWFNNVGSFTVTVTSDSPGAGTPVIANAELPVTGGIFTVTGGMPPYTFSVHDGSLPQGLTLSSAGQIQGMMTAGGLYNVTIRVTDSTGAFSDKAYTDNVDIGAPEIALRRIIITDNGAGLRSAKFEVGASDDLALVPADPAGFIANISQSLQSRYRLGNGPFTPWVTGPYYPGALPPTVVNYGQNDQVQVEVRSLDWSGNTSIPLAYEINKAVITPTVDRNEVPEFDPPVTIPGTGNKVVRLITDRDIDGDGRPDILAADGATGKITLARNTTGKVAGIKHSSIILPDATLITDLAVGKLLPLKATDRTDANVDIVVAAGTHLRLARGNGKASPAFKQLARAEEDLTHGDSLFRQVAVGDVNGDGADDIVAVAGDEESPDQLLVFLNTAGASANAGFQPAQALTVPAAALYSLAVEDLNGDGLADIVAGGPADDGTPQDQTLYCWLGRYEALPTAPTATVVGAQIMDLKIAAYTGHFTGQKDVIVATLEGPDAAYAGSTNLVKHRVLVHQGQGVFRIAAARHLSTVTQTGLGIEEQNLGNIAVGDVSGDGAPEIFGNQYDTTTGATLDPGFLPPANEAGELNWMESTTNGVVTLGTVTGKTRRVGLIDLDGNGVSEVVLANADSGNLDLLLNRRAVGAMLPKGVKELASPLAPSSVVMAPLVSSPPGQGLANGPWTFGCKLGTAALAQADVQVWVQCQLNNGAWIALPGGLLGKISKTNFATVVNAVPAGYVRFRLLVLAPNSGMNPAASVPSAYYRTRTGQDLEVSIVCEPDSRSATNLNVTHDDETMTYRLRYRNRGSVAAQNVVVAGAIPLNTRFDSGGSSASRWTRRALHLRRPNSSGGASAPWHLGRKGRSFTSSVWMRGRRPN